MSGSAKQGDLWSLADCSVKRLTRSNFLLIRRDTGATAALDEQWRPYLRHLLAFGTAADHAAAIVNASPKLKGQERNIASSLEPIFASGVFVSARELGSQLAASVRVLEQSPVTVVITTCDRPDSLRRLLVSLRENRKRFSSDWTCEVIDDSRSDDSRQANRVAVEEVAESYPITYIGPDEQRAFIDQLCSLLPESADSLSWLLSNQHPLNQGLPTYGVPVNIAMLRHAGRRILFVDDDSKLDAWVRPDAEDFIAFDNSSSAPVVCTDVAAGRSEFVSYEENPLDKHIKCLGEPLANVIKTQANRRSPADVWRKSSSKELADLNPISSGVRFTTNAVLGDPGTDYDFKVYNLLPPEISCDAQRYRAFRSNPRCLFSGRTHPSLHTEPGFQRATVAGLNLAPYMAPVMPTGRGEDNLLGKLMRFLYPQDFGVRLQFGLEHLPPEPREWMLAPDLLKRDRYVAYAGVEQWLQPMSLAKELEPDLKMQMAAQGLAVLATEKDATERLSGGLLAGFFGQLADTHANLAEILETNPKGCDTWKKDLEAAIRFIQGEMKNRRGPPNAVVDRMVRMTKQYAEAIPAWNRAFAYCRENRLGD